MISKTDDMDLIMGCNGSYAINRKGDIFKRNKNGWRKLKPFLVSGYKAVGIPKNGKRRNVHIHRLLAEIYIQNPNQNDCVIFKDGDKGNISINNLMWGSHSDKGNHSFDIGKSTHCAENCHTAKITADIARNIFQMKGRVKQKDIAKMYNISTGAVHKIIVRKSWRRATDDLCLV